ncbi:MAG TPA: sigma factor, partial [Gemmataceae bacterium]|nr:sigma factor [Gemmataceae bacterium]
MELTPHSLIVRLRQRGDAAAWRRFVELFTPLLDQWARRLGLQGADTEDLIQDVFAILLKYLPQFRHDPNRSFRSW